MPSWCIISQALCLWRASFICWVFLLLFVGSLTGKCSLARWVLSIWQEAARQANGSICLQGSGFPLWSPTARGRWESYGTDWYEPLFRQAARLYGAEVYAYYFDLPFEETLRRHQTKPNCGEFGEEAMRRWWREKDFSPVLKEKSITSEKELQDIVGEICGEVLACWLFEIYYYLTTQQACDMLTPPTTWKTENWRKQSDPSVENP